MFPQPGSFSFDEISDEIVLTNKSTEVHLINARYWELEFNYYLASGKTCNEQSERDQIYTMRNLPGVLLRAIVEIRRLLQGCCSCPGDRSLPYLRHSSIRLVCVLRNCLPSPRNTRIQGFSVSLSVIAFLFLDMTVHTLLHRVTVWTAVCTTQNDCGSACDSRVFYSIGCPECHSHEWQPSLTVLRGGTLSFSDSGCGSTAK